MEQSKRLRYSIILLSSYTFAWMTLGWIFWVLGGCKAIMPFISDLDLYQPGDTIFTLGAIGSSFLAIWFLFELQNTRHKYLLKNNFNNFWVAFNYVSVVPGIVAAVSCFRIGYTPWNVDGILVLPGVTFKGSSLLSCSLSTSFKDCFTILYKSFFFIF